MNQPTQPTPLTTLETAVLEGLRASVEGTESTFDGFRWGSVYIDNAKPAAMSRRAFAGVLSNLQQKGLYRPYGDDLFGDVRLASPALAVQS